MTDEKEEKTEQIDYDPTENYDENFYRSVWQDNMNSDDQIVHIIIDDFCGDGGKQAFILTADSDYDISKSRWMVRL